MWLYFNSYTEELTWDMPTRPTYRSLTLEDPTRQAIVKSTTAPGSSEPLEGKFAITFEDKLTIKFSSNGDFFEDHPLQAIIKSITTPGTPQEPLLELIAKLVSNNDFLEDHSLQAIVKSSTTPGTPKELLSELKAEMSSVSEFLEDHSLQAIFKSSTTPGTPEELLSRLKAEMSSKQFDWCETRGQYSIEWVNPIKLSISADGVLEKDESWLVFYFRCQTLDDTGYMSGIIHVMLASVGLFVECLNLQSL